MRVIFRKTSNYKKPETQPKPVMSNPNPTRTRRNISKPDPNPKKISKPKPDIWQPNPSLLGINQYPNDYSKRVNLSFRIVYFI